MSYVFAASRTRNAALIVVMSLLLSACGTGLQLDRLNPFKERERPLPGTRVAVLTDTDALTVNPALAQRPIVLPAARANQNWAQPGGEASNSPGHLALSSSPNRAWRVNAGKGSDKDARLTNSPVVYGGRVFVMDVNGKVGAYSASGGGRIWSVSIVPEGEDDDGITGGGLAADNDLLFVATGYGELIAINPGSGQRVWTKDLGIPIRSAPTAAGGRVFLVTADNRVHALSQVDGSQEWTYRGIPETTGLLANASPAVADGLVVVPYSSGEIIAFDVATGQPSWADSLTRTRRATSLSGINDVAARPVVDRGVVYAVSVSGRMVASKIKSGERIWSRNLASAQTPVAAGDAIFVVTLDDRIVALSRDDGEVRWVTDLPRGEDNDVVWAGPVLAGGRLWITSSDGRLMSVDPATGQSGGGRDVGDDIFLGPVVASGKLYVLTDKANLIAFN
jgi:outer membrane protein assembly factor BamB